MYQQIRRKRVLIFKTMLSVAIVVAMKLAAHWFDCEVISLNSLFSGIVAANVFAGLPAQRCAGGLQGK